MTAIDWRALRAPFAVQALEWRVGRVSGDGSYASLLTYVTARAIQDRLDDVVGPDRWQVTYEQWPTGVLATIGIQCEAGVWVEKTDGADPSDIEAFKGALSGAMKRAAVQWGIGRYLYALEETWHRVEKGERSKGRGIDVSAKGQHVGYVPWPEMPVWAVPPGTPTRYGSSAIPGMEEERPTPEPRKATTTPAGGAAPKCELCGGEVWDNRANKRTPTSPDYKCKSKACGHPVWLTPKGGAAQEREPGQDDDGERPPPPDDIPFSEPAAV